MKQPVRTFDLKVLVFLLLLASVFGWLRLQQSLMYADRLAQLEISVPPLYLGISGAVFGITMLAAGVWLWLGLSGYRPLVGSVVGLFCAWFWIDRLLLSLNPAARANDLFILSVTAFFLVFTIAVLAAHPPNYREGTTPPSTPAPAEEDAHEDARN